MTLGIIVQVLLPRPRHCVRHPLQEVGFTKAEVRELARHWNLPTLG